jgi:4-amino-4-deoxy-L-arabinose transferase-like glycosyltransferase
MIRFKSPDTLLYLVLAFFTILVYITGLFPEMTVDSGKYAAVSRQIFESGDFIHLKVRGEAYLQKPPLLFWLGALSFKIFGMSNAAFKLPTLLFPLPWVYSTFRLGRLVFNRETGQIAATIYGISIALFLYNMDVHTDVLMTSNIIFATWQLAEYVHRRKALNFILGFLGVGLAMISKGMIGIAVPAFAVGGYLIMKRDFRTLFSLRWLAGIPIVVLVLFPAVMGIYGQFGPEGLKFYFWSNNMDRITGVGRTNPNDYAFVFHTLLWLFLPWSLFMFTAFVKDGRHWIANRFTIGNKEVVYCYAVIIIFGLIVSVSNQQAPHYLLPAVPFVAIITAKGMFDATFSDLFPRTFRWMMVARILLMALIWPAIFLLLTFYLPTRSLLIWIPIGILLLLSWSGIFWLRTRAQRLMIPLITTIMAMGFTINTVYMDNAIEYYGAIQASYFFNENVPDDAELYTYRYIHYETYYYPEKVSGWIKKGTLDSSLEEGSFWLITSEKGFKDVVDYDPGIITEKHVFPYKGIVNVSFRFLNPRTREETLKNIYLLKIR